MAKYLIGAVLVFFVPLFSYADSSYIWKLFTIPSGLQVWAIEKVYAADATEQDFILNYIRSKDGDFGVRSKIIEAVARCESDLNPRAVGDKGKAYGVMQFWKGTFNSFKESANMPDLEYKNWQDQIDLSYWAFGNGLRSHWTCYRQLYL